MKGILGCLCVLLMMGLALCAAPTVATADVVSVDIAAIMVAAPGVAAVSDYLVATPDKTMNIKKIAGVIDLAAKHGVSVRRHHLLRKLAHRLVEGARRSPGTVARLICPLRRGVATVTAVARSHSLRGILGRLRVRC